MAQIGLMSKETALVGHTGKGITASLLLAVAAVASAAPPAATPSYKNRDFGYRFQPPVNWEHKTDMPKTTAAFLGPTEAGFTANLTVTIYPQKVESKDLQKFVNGFKLDNATMLDMRRCTVDGEPGYTWRTKLNIPGHPAAENRQVVCIHNNHGYELTFTVGAGQMARGYSTVCDKWLASFGWIKSSSPLLKQHNP